MRLRNRIVKATYYTDPDLCRMPRDKRDFYRSLWACAEDSACLEDDMFGVKLSAWPSPLDADMTVELFEQWRDELIADGKLVTYEVEGRSYLYIPTMAEHESPRNPQSPDCPLPEWVTWTPNASDGRKGRYEHSSDLREGCTSVVQGSNNDATTVPVLPCTVLPCPDLSGPERGGPANDPAPEARKTENIPPCLAQEYDKSRWYDKTTDTDHETPIRAVWSAIENATGGLVTPIDRNIFAAQLTSSLPCSGCEGSLDDIEKCVTVCVKAAEKTKGRPSHLFAKIVKEDR